MSRLTIPQALQLALQHQQAHEFQQAESICRQILAAEPEQPDALYLLGTLAQQLNNHAAAVDLLRSAVRARPREAHFRMALGVSYVLTNDRQLAIYEMKQAVSLAPDLVEARLNLAKALRDVSAGESIAHFEKALQQRPNQPDIHVELAASFHVNGDDSSSERHLRKALELNPALADAHHNLGVICIASNRREEAITHFRAAVELRPDYAKAHYNLAVALAESAPADEQIEHFRQMLRLHPNNQDAADSVLQLLHYLPDTDLTAAFQAHLNWASVFEAPLLPQPALFIPPLALDPEARLRVGLLSRDFRDHSVAYFLEPILEARDRSRLEIFCYADELVTDHVTARLRGLADHWRPITALDDAGVARLIAADNIDIAIDLAGHTDGNRLLALARRPAPIQMTWLGYADTTGLSSIQHRLTDAYADPPGQTESLHTENLLRLETNWCYRPPADAPPLAPDLPVTRAGHVTFGCFNVLSKINSPLIAQWAKLLGRVAGSRLILKSRGFEREEARQRIFGEFAAHAIATDRIELIERTPSLRDHLALYGRIDVALDTFPYHGTTTTCEALWMGVPVVTLAGRRHAQRVGVSLLNSAGMNELIAGDWEAYIEFAARLAADETRRGELRRGLRDQLGRSILLDAPRAARAFEGALRSLWRQRIS